MLVRLDYSHKEMKSFLSKRGYTFKEITEEVGHSAYHNRVEYEPTKFIVLFKDGKRIPDKDHSFHHAESKEGFLEDTFNDVFSKELIELLNGNNFLNK